MEPSWAATAATLPVEQAAKVGKPHAVPSYDNGVFTVSCATVIDAPPLVCLETTLDTTKFPSWNTFCPEVGIDLAPEPPAAESHPELRELATRPGYIYKGVHMHFNARMTPSGSPYKTDLETTLLERFEHDGRMGYRVAWKVRGRTWFLRAERVQEFLDGRDENGNPNGSTEYRCWETFGGVISHYLNHFMYAQIEDGFARWMIGLKKASEENAKQEGGG